MKKRAMLSLMLAAGLIGCYSVRMPNSSLDLYLRGQLEAERGRLPQALATLTKAIEQNPRMGLAYVARGAVYKEEGNYEKAAADFERATKLEPYNYTANFQLGLMYQYLKRFAESVGAYQKAVEIRPLDPEANMNLALAYTQLGEPLRGLPYAQRAVQGNEDSPTTHANLGMLYAQIEYDSAAIDSLKRSIELNSRQPEVYVNLARIYMKDSEKKYDQARSVLETARALAPSPMVMDTLGVVYYRQSDLDKAKDAFNEALRIDPNYFTSLNGLGVVAMSRALMASPPDVPLAREAVDYWNKSLAIKSDQPKIQQLLNKYTPPQ